MFEYKCMYLFSKTKCIFKYEFMHVNARGYGITVHHVHDIHSLYIQRG